MYFSNLSSSPFASLRKYERIQTHPEQHRPTLYTTFHLPLYPPLVAAVFLQQCKTRRGTSRDEARHKAWAYVESVRLHLPLLRVACSHTHTHTQTAVAACQLPLRLCLFSLVFFLPHLAILCDAFVSCQTSRIRSVCPHLHSQCQAHYA